MDQVGTIVEFDGIIDPRGRISVPQPVLERFRGGAGGKVRVRLTLHRIASELKRRSVTEDEIDRIARVQLETRDQVVRFLFSEGALGKTGFRARSVKRKRKGSAVERP
jgi:hypothetical protein